MFNKYFSDDNRPLNLRINGDIKSPVNEDSLDRGRDDDEDDDIITDDEGGERNIT